MKRVITLLHCEAEITTYNDEMQQEDRRVGKMTVIEAKIPDHVRDWLWSQMPKET